MYTKDNIARESLIKAGKAEFLKYGFEHASLRRICKNARVTTGAVYSCFGSKENLFRAIVGSTVEELKHIMQESFDTECREERTALDNDVIIIDYLWYNKDIVLILLEGAKGTCYADTFSSIETSMADFFSRYFFLRCGFEIDKDLVALIVRMRIKSYIEILRAGYSLEHTRMLAEKLSIYANTGFAALMQNANHTSD